MIWRMMNFYQWKFVRDLDQNLLLKYPQLLEDITKQCVDADPLKRPTADYLREKFHQWHFNGLHNSNNSEIIKQIKEADEFNKKQPTLKNLSLNDTELTYTTHPQAIYTSRLLNFKNLPEPKNADDGEIDYSGN